MKRITQKDKSFFRLTEEELNNACYLAEIYTKLKLLENIEETYNIDILKAEEICKKLNTQGYYYKKIKYGDTEKIELVEIINHHVFDVEICQNRLYSNVFEFYCSLSLDEYGKEWALTKEELE